MAPDPQTPSKKAQPNLFDTKISLLSQEWDLRLRTKDDYSPEKMNRSLNDQCLNKIRFLHHKKAFDHALHRFRTEATILYSGWVHKPKQDRGVVPEATRHRPRPVTEEERVELLRLLLRILKEDMAKWMTEHSPSSVRFGSSENVDDRPLPLELGPSPNSDPKRQRDEEGFSNLPIAFKKPRKPESATSTSKVDSIATAAKGPQPPATGSMLPPETRSANTSFVSDVSSVFSRRLSYNSSWQQGTQETVPDDELVPHSQAVKDSFKVPQPDKASSTDYGTSSFEERMADVDEAALGINSSPEYKTADEGEGEELSQDLLGMAFDKDTLLVDSEQEFQDSLLPAEKQFNDSLLSVFCEFSL